MRALIHTQKGGVGKTTTALNLAAALMRQGYGRRVVLADLDPQQHLTAMVSTVRDPNPTSPLLPVLGEPGLYLLPGAALAREDGIAVPHEITSDWTILDSAPSWSPLIAQASRWADVILCPLEPDFLGMAGVGRLLEHIQSQGVGQDRLRFLLTRFNPRLALHREVRSRLADRFGPLVLPVEIRSSIKLAEAPGMGRTIFAHAAGSTGSSDYFALAAALAGTRPIGVSAA